MGSGRDFELARRFAGQLFDTVDRLLGLRGLLHALFDLGDLDVHGPDQLVHAVGLHDRMLDRMLLPLERLGLARDVLGERVERGQPLVGRATELDQLRDGAKLRLDLFTVVIAKAASSRTLRDPSRIFAYSCVSETVVERR